MQYIQYWKTNQNLQLFVIFPTHAKYIRFWKKKMSIKQRLRVGGHFCPQPYFFQLRSHPRRYYSGGATWFRPPPHLLYQDHGGGPHIFQEEWNNWILAWNFLQRRNLYQPLAKNLNLQWIMSKPWTA